MVATIAISVLAHVALLVSVSAALGCGYLFGNLRLAPLVAAGVVFLGLLPVASREVFRALRRAGSRGQTPLWALPLGQLAATLSATICALALPATLGRSDFWRDLLDVSPGPFTDLVVLSSLVMMGGCVVSFVLLSYEWIRHGMVREIRGPNSPTRLALALGGGLLPLLVLLTSAFPSDNLAYLTAWKAYSFDRDAERALAGFRRLAEAPASSPLVDNALFRLALLERELGRSAEALEALRQLRQRCPASPLVDDATFLSGRLLLARGDAVAASRELELVTERWPSSCLADDALLALYRIARDRGDEQRAQALFERIRRDCVWRFAEVDTGAGKPRFVRTVELVP
ncbi:MAG: tetratricopeptide repeat protein [Candidatus Wallbacteria bacterium]|nr:tetratricopeptide repeat protein [Candidatus Wallbacteria bacterium]